jgi:chromosome segregation ATPase
MLHLKKEILIMRKIFKALENTPKPCLDEKAALKVALDTYIAFRKVLLKLQSDNALNIASLASAKKLVKNIEATVASIVREIAKSLEQIAYYQNIKPNKLNNKWVIKSYEKLINYLQNYITKNLNIQEIHERTIEIVNNNITKAEAVIEKNKTEIAKQSKQELNLQTEITNASSAIEKCLSSPLYTRLNLNHSCTELKQNIKIVNQKSISLDNKLINLNSGTSSLEVLNANKDFLDENIKTAKEFIILLDELNPNPNPSDSSFFDVYEKAQEDLASYKEKRKILKTKIKISEEKIKTIPDKQNTLEDKTSNKIQKFVDCKTPTVI